MNSHVNQSVLNIVIMKELMREFILVYGSSKKSRFSVIQSVTIYRYKLDRNNMSAKPG